MLYLDELGTSVDMSSLTDGSLREAILRRDQFSDHLHDDKLNASQRYLSFSDNLVVGGPVDRGSADRGLFSYIYGAARYQFNLAILGRFLRGGITQGPLYIDDRFVTGQALLSAVKIEEQVAVYPRVVIAECCLPGIVGEIRYYAEPRDAPENDLILLDGDAKIFVNYLSVLAEDMEFGATSARVTDMLRLHAAKVREKLGQFDQMPHIREKYAWVAQYHNYVCTEILNRPELILDVNDGLTPYESTYGRPFRTIC